VIVKTIAGFLNSKGGSLLIGVADDGFVIGISDDLATLGKRSDRDGYQQFLTGLLKETIGGVPTSASLSISFHVAQGKELCLLSASSANEPVYVKDGTSKRFYLRTQNTTQELDIEQASKYIKKNWRE
jgi:predicted HTH transcriptional regulator